VLTAIVVPAFLLAGPGGVLTVLAFAFLGAVVLVTVRDMADLLRTLRDGPAVRDRSCRRPGKPPVRALARFRRHPGLSLRKTTRRLTKTVRRHLPTVLPPPVLAFAAAVGLTAWAGWRAADLWVVGIQTAAGLLAHGAG